LPNYKSKNNDIYKNEENLLFHVDSKPKKFRVPIAQSHQQSAG